MLKKINDSIKLPNNNKPVHLAKMRYVVRGQFWVFSAKYYTLFFDTTNDDDAYIREFFLALPLLLQ